MRRGVVLVVFAVALVAGWLGYSKYTQAQREASYRTALAPYKRDLTVGMDRDQVIAYLRAHEEMCLTVRTGGSDGDTCEIKIAEEPVGLLEGLFCEPWTVYVAFEFTSADKLREIHIRKIGTCLQGHRSAKAKATRVDVTSTTQTPKEIRHPEEWGTGRMVTPRPRSYK